MKLMESIKKAAADRIPVFSRKDLKTVLIKGEKMDKSYVLSEEAFIFTDKRLIIRNASASDIEFTSCQSIPYRSIIRFSLEIAGEQNVIAILHLWLHGDDSPLRKELVYSPTIVDFHRTLADFVLNKTSPWMNKRLKWKKESGIGTAVIMTFAGVAVLTAHSINTKMKKDIKQTYFPVKPLLQKFLK